MSQLDLACPVKTAEDAGFGYYSKRADSITSSDRAENSEISSSSARHRPIALTGNAPRVIAASDADKTR
jgi:hypothetical protein